MSKKLSLLIACLFITTLSFAQKANIQSAINYLKENDIEKAKKMIYSLTEELYSVARLLHPIMPETSRVIKEAVLQNKKSENLFPRLQ